MNSLFCFVLPSILGIKFLIEINKNLKIKDIIVYYLLLVLLSNFLCIGIIELVNHFNGNLMFYCAEHLNFSFKYILLSMIINLILAFSISLIIKYLSITLEVKDDKTKI